MSEPDYAGWAHYDGCVVCPRCNTFTTVDDDIDSILAGIASHACTVARAQAATAAGSVTGQKED